MFYLKGVMCVFCIVWLSKGLDRYERRAELLHRHRQYPHHRRPHAVIERRESVFDTVVWWSEYICCYGLFA